MEKVSMKREKGVSKSSMVVLFLLVFMLVAPVMSFAGAGTFQGDKTATDNLFTANDGIGKAINVILGFFQSNIMRAICTIALGGLGIGVLMNRGEPGMVKKFIPWIAGVGILLSLSMIVGIVWPA